jgi:hypothetical protein
VLYKLLALFDQAVGAPRGLPGLSFSFGGCDAVEGEPGPYGKAAVCECEGMCALGFLVYMYTKEEKEEAARCF